MAYILLNCRIFANYSNMKNCTINRNVLVFIALSLLCGTSCVSQHEMLIRSTDHQLKYEKAMEFFEARKYTKALQLYDQIAMTFRGTTKDDTLQYFTALTNYHLSDFVTAGDQFNNFAQIFPRSPFTKMARFLRLDCMYETTYRYELDQLPSTNAIAAIEEFRYDFPRSEFDQTCLNMLDDLHDRLERKSFESAKLYYTIEDYKAAQYALKQSLKENPDSRYREDVLYYIVAASFKYAENSLSSLQRERFLNVIDEYYNFVSEFPDSHYRKDVESMFKKAQNVTTRTNITQLQDSDKDGE